MWKDFLYYTKTERQGIIVFVVLILGVYTAPKLFAFFTRISRVEADDSSRLVFHKCVPLYALYG